MEAENITTPISTEFSARKLFSKEQAPLQQMENEFKPRQISVLKPLQSVSLPKIDDKDPEKTTTEDITQEIEDDFDYLSRTRNLETNTPRTKILQEQILDKFTKGTDIQTRAIIMNKGANEEMFVYPDGTVFVSQSCINALDWLDEIAALKTHELNHLILKTPSKIREARTGAQKFGVGWIHEAASDNVMKFMEKAGFNSLAFSTAIEKISGTKRGSIHQSGLSRASQSIGHHGVIDSTTSSINLTPIPPELKREAKKTNLELINEIIKREPDIPIQKAKEYLTGTWRKEFGTALELLHKKDLGQIYNSYNGGGETRVQLLDICEKLITKRLQEHGFSSNDSLFFLMHNIPSWSPKEYNLIKTVEELGSIADSLEVFENTDKLTQMYRQVFNKVPAGPAYEPPTKLFMRVLEDNLYDINFEKRKNGIPVTRETLVNALDKIDKTTKSFSPFDKEIPLTRVLAKYISKTYLARAENNKETVTIDQIKPLFEEFKTKGIILDKKTLDEFFLRKLSVEYYNKTLDIPDENKNIVKKAFDEVFEIQAEDFGFKEIDDFFQELNQLNDKNVLEKFTKNLNAYFGKNKFTDQQRLPYLQYVNQKIDTSMFKNDFSLLQYLEGNSSQQKELTPDEKNFNNLISRFNLKMIMAIGLFEKDGPEFYSFLEQAMNNSGLDPDQLSQTQLINLCQGIFARDATRTPHLYWYGPKIDTIWVFKPLSLENNGSLLELPFTAKIMEKDQDLHFTNIHDLNTHIKSGLQKTYLTDSTDLFEDNLLSLITGRAVRDNFHQLLEAGIPEKDYNEFYDFIDKFYPKGVQKDQFLREINKLYLNSPNISLDDKTDYLVKHFDKVGPQGMVIIADEIKDIDTYEIFRGKIGTKLNDYLEGSDVTAAIALTDFFSSSLVGNFDDLLQTTSINPKTSGEISTFLARRWFRQTFHGRSEKNDTAPYDKSKEKFILNNEERVVFRTFKDLTQTLKNLTPLERFATAHKALLDTGGALTSPKNKEILGKRLVESLGLSSGFVSSVLKAACLEADAKLIGFPTASMLGPLLFRAIDVNEVDLKEVSKGSIYRNQGDDVKLNTLLSENEISNILRANTRGITLFGPKYQADPNSAAGELCRKSDLKYQQITDRLNALFNKTQNGEAQPTEKTEINPAIEAVIKGVETSGALGIRALQLASQFSKLEPALEKRLSESLDSNPGLNKLLFWENLNKLAEEDPSIKSFLQRIILHDYLGGGSLQTTYGATYRNDDGSEREVILKMKNPNVAAFIRESYSSAHKALEVVSNQRFGGKSRESAKTGMALMDLAQKWCLDDLNDTSFVKDDDLFRQTIDKYNLQTGSDQFYAPE
ncbi:MAG: hypothetical protein KKB74_11825, partial [Bacteroidetes bacterium]|nr:hypothetical protein [Bacteroidota bacterium]